MAILTFSLAKFQVGSLLVCGMAPDGRRCDDSIYFLGCGEDSRTESLERQGTVPETEKVHDVLSCLVVFDSLQPHRL